jgi:hypothetical protein
MLYHLKCTSNSFEFFYVVFETENLVNFAQAGLKLAISSLYLWCIWDYRHVPPYPASHAFLNTL